MFFPFPTHVAFVRSCVRGWIFKKEKWQNINLGRTYGHAMHNGLIESLHACFQTIFLRFEKSTNYKSFKHFNNYFI